MASDEELTHRIRDVLGADVDVSEKRMFGSDAFLANGNLAVAASGQGGLMVRVDPSETEALVARAGVSRMVMRGREMDGWLRVTDESVAEDDTLREWVERGIAFARSLPPKA